MRIWWKLCLAAALAGTNTTAWADEVEGADKPAGETPSLFQRLDTNGDGQLTAEEVPAEHKRLFERLLRTAGKGADGTLSASEFEAGLRDDGPRPGPGPGGPDPRRPGGQFPQLDAEAIFRRMDVNGDGKVLADEIPAERREFFVRIIERGDANKDGALDLEEYRAVQREFAGMRRPEGAPNQPPPGAGPGGDPLFRALDRNGNGTLDRDEIYGAGVTLLEQFDRNRDGSITREEIGPPPLAGRPGPGGEGMAGIEQMMERLRQADADGDGRISRDEAPDRMRENFDRMDRNGDGFIDREEVRATLTAMAAAGQMPGRPGQPPGGPRPDVRRPEGERPDGPRPEGQGPAGAPRPEGARPEGPRPDGPPRTDGDRPGGPRPEGQRPGGPGGPQGRRPEGGIDPQNLVDQMLRSDADEDGKLSREEASERMRENFDRIDTNGDGFIDRAELRQMVERMPAGGRPGGFRGEGPRPGQPGPDGRPQRPGGERPAGERPQRPERPESEPPAEKS